MTRESQNSFKWYFPRKNSGSNFLVVNIGAQEELKDEIEQELNEFQLWGGTTENLRCVQRKIMIWINCCTKENQGSRQL
mgnify:FL=1